MKSSAQLKDLTLKIGSGSTPRGGKGSYLSNGEITLIRSQNIYNHRFKPEGLAYISTEQADKLKSVEVFEDDILINITGDSIARNMVVQSDMLPARVNQHVSIIRCDTDKLDPYYLSAILTSQKMQTHLLSMGQVGATRAALTKKMLEDIEIPLCDIKTQRNIGSLLNVLNAKIMSNNKVIATIEEISSLLFKSWFIHFNFPDEDGNPYKDNGGEMVETELGEIPEGWELKHLKEIVSYSSKAFNPRKGTTKKVAHFSIPEFDTRVFPVIAETESIKSNKYYVNESSIMVSKMNPDTPRVWLPNISKLYDNVCSTEFIVLNSPDSNIKSFTYELCKSTEFTNFLISNATGSTNSRQRVTPSIAINYTFPWCEKKAEEFGEMMKNNHLLILKLREQNMSLISLRSELFPKILSGEIELPSEEEV